MKPKFALDLSHEGINLLHRSRGGWTLVGSVALDDANMRRHLADLRRRAAELESGGFTSKIIIPNSQILYTTLEAPGPDDIAREVQIRSGLDGLTPYNVGELVFDWRAAGEKARVAVLARETMDEAESFAVEHKFNPVSFVARPESGEFSGEPFFGKTRAATRILGPTERVEPDASPVPRQASAARASRVSAAIAAVAAEELAAAARQQKASARPAPHPAPQPQPHPAPQPQPQPHPAPQPQPQPQPHPAPQPQPQPHPAPQPQPGNTAPPAQPPGGAADDPFTELDAIQAELTGKPVPAPHPAPAPRPRSGQQTLPNRTGATGSGAARQPVPPPLAPFPPTPDETAPAQSSDLPAAGAHAAPDGKAKGQPDRRAPYEDDTPAPPGVAFSTRRSGGQTTTIATPSAQREQAGAKTGSTGHDGGAAMPAPAPQKPQKSPPSQAGHTRPARKDLPPVDRRRADMADALSRPLPGKDGKADSAEMAPEEPSARSRFAGVMRGAAGGLRAFSQRRGAGKGSAKGSAKAASAAGGIKDIGDIGGIASERAERAERSAAKAAEEPRRSSAEAAGSSGAKPAPGSSMQELMRDAGEAVRISPSSETEEPGLLAPGIPAEPDPGPQAGPPDPDPQAGPPDPDPQAGPPEASPEAGAESGATSQAAETPDAPASAADPSPEAAAPSAEVAPAATPRPQPLPKPRVPPRPKVDITPAPSGLAPARPGGFNAFATPPLPEKTGLRRYSGLILIVLLVLSMAVIGVWSTLFVNDGETPLFNPGDTPGTGITTAPATDPAVAPQPPAQPEPATGTGMGTGTQPDTEPDPGASATETPAEPDAPAPRVLSQEEAAARYAESQIWQRAPEAMAEPHSPGLDAGDISGPGALRGDPAGAATSDDTATAPSAPTGAGRATPLAPPPADTRFDLDENGLVRPTPEGALSPSGIVVYQGPPKVVPPPRPGVPAPNPTSVPPAPAPQAPETPLASAPAAAPEQIPAETVAAATPPFLPDMPDTRPVPRPGEPAQGTVQEASAQAATGQPAAMADTGQISAAIEAAVDVASTSFVNPTAQAVVHSPKPIRRPDDIARIVSAANARAAADAEARAAATAAAATVTPTIPTSASVAERATTPGALNLRQINLLGISGPTNARRALVRMPNGRYVTVKTGDRLDGGRVTSITDNGLTYQKGSRNYALQLLPLG